MEYIFPTPFPTDERHLSPEDRNMNDLLAEPRLDFPTRCPTISNNDATVSCSITMVR